jgi:hypothetical protein
VPGCIWKIYDGMVRNLGYTGAVRIATRITYFVLALGGWCHPISAIRWFGSWRGFLSSRSHRGRRHAPRAAVFAKPGPRHDNATMRGGHVGVLLAWPSRTFSTVDPLPPDAALQTFAA